jgi:hypothetical protein
MFANSALCYTKCSVINKRTLDSLDFYVIRFTMKIFKTSNRLLASDCVNYVGFSLPIDLVTRRVDRFMQQLSVRKQSHSTNMFAIGYARVKAMSNLFAEHVCPYKGYIEHVRRTCSKFTRVMRQSSARPRLQYSKKKQANKIGS